MARGLRTVTAAPAQAAELMDRGVLAIGMRADLVRFSEVDGLPVIRSVMSQGRQV